jgi:Tol biopolymer transport system component/Mg-chelatase subunit ChlD
MAAIPACTDVHVVWARGSGVPTGDDPAFDKFSGDLKARIGTAITFSSYSLGQDSGYGGFQYPAVGDPISLILARGDWTAYHLSVIVGTLELRAYLTDRIVDCPDEKYVLAGHSQGAQVITDGLALLPQEIRNRIAYSAVFGDPSWDNGPYGFIHLPSPDFASACLDGPHQWVRGSAPCYKGPGIIGLTKDPYVAVDSEQRVGAWCRELDGICGGSLADIATHSDAHGAYFDENAESAEAAREAAEALRIFLPDRASEFDVSWDQFVFGAAGADLAIVFDTTGSMAGAIDDAKAQATELAQTWLDFFKNGRVALVEFKDEGDPLVAQIDAGLNSDVTAFQAAMNGLTASGGGDYPEAQLSGVMRALNGLDWTDDATKVTIVITDAPGKDPEPGTGYTRDQVSQRALEIDPVAIYGVDVANSLDVRDFMQPMADATAGDVLTLQSGQTLSDALFDVLDAAHAAPVARIHGPYFGQTGQPLTFSARESFDASATITSYEWDLNADGAVDATTTDPEVAYTYLTDYNGLMSVRVNAADGLSALATAEVNVDAEGLANDLPLSAAEVSATVTGPSEVTVGWIPAENDRADGYFVTKEDGTLVGIALATDDHSLAVQDVDVTQPLTFLVSSGNQFGRSAPVAGTSSTGNLPVTTERVSESSQHGQASGSSDDAWISADGRYVTFVSTASDLVAGDTNGAQDIFVHDRSTDETIRVSVANDGSQATSFSDDPALTADGRKVIFKSYASNLVAGDTNAKWDIFVRDLDAGTTTRVSVASDGTQSNGTSGDPVPSADGRSVAFSSSASNLVAGDTNAVDDIFVHDTVTGTTARASLSSAGVQANAGSDDPSISADGRYLAFWSDASTLVPGDTNGVRDIFVRDTQTGTTTRASVASDGTQANAASDNPSISDDGSLLAFDSDASTLVSGDTNAKTDIFVRDLAAGTTRRVNLTQAGAQAERGSDSPSISGDGTIVSFQSSARTLISGDTNNRNDIYAVNLADGTLWRVSVAADGSQAADASDNPAITADGATIAFQSMAVNLVPNDTNGTSDSFVRGSPY